MPPFTGYPWEYNNKRADYKTINLSLHRFRASRVNLLSRVKSQVFYEQFSDSYVYLYERKKRSAE
jgi:hypothetical protein